MTFARRNRPFYASITTSSWRNSPTPLASNPSGWLRRTVGILLLVVGLAVILGLDKQFQAFVLEQGWYDPIKQFEESITG